MPQRDHIRCIIGISGVKTIVHEFHMKGQGHGQRETEPLLMSGWQDHKFRGFSREYSEAFLRYKLDCCE